MTRLKKVIPRRPFVAGNWKMHRTASDTKNLIEDIVQRVQKIANVDMVVCPPFTSLAAATETLGRHSVLAVGAQNMHQAKEGAFTGEISGTMLRDLGVRYVILGHSERRQFFNETDAAVAAKAVTAVSYLLRPIVCVGETLAQREAKETMAVVETQIRASRRARSRWYACRPSAPRLCRSGPPTPLSSAIHPPSSSRSSSPPSRWRAPTC
jgi:triosephosphate isomerase